MEKIVETLYTILDLIADREDYALESKQDDEGIYIKIYASQKSFPLILGKKGQNINAIRTIMRIVTARQDGYKIGLGLFKMK